MQISRLILSDVDGTLLDEQGAIPSEWDAMRAALEPGDLFVLVSSRTTTELLEVQELLGIQGPLVSENGSMVVLGSEWPGVLAGRVEQVGDRSLRVLALGSRRPTLMTMMRDVAATCNLSLTSTEDPGFLADPGAAAPGRIVLLDDAATRHRSLLAQVVSTRRQRDELESALAARGLAMVSGGRWRVIQCGSNKGIGGSVLRNMLHAQRCRPQVIAIGDHANDRALLSLADVRFAVRRPDGGVHPSLADLPGVLVPDAPGPEAWGEIARFLGAREVQHA